MRHPGISFICAVGLFAASAHAQQSKPNLSGKWQLNAGKSALQSGKNSMVSLTIEQAGPSIHVVRTRKAGDGKEETTEFKCTTDGKDCDAANGTKVSLWWDGASLIEMDIGAEAVSKHKMTLATDGKSLNCDVNWISPQSAAETLVFEKL